MQEGAIAMSVIEAGTDLIVSDDFDFGYADAWEDFIPDEPVGDPVSSEDYRLGWWCGIGDVKAFYDGWQAYDNGLRCCPYVVGSDEACFREPWLNGYWQAMVAA